MSDHARRSKEMGSEAEEEKHHEPELTLRSGLALAGAALAYFVTVGFLNAFGVFQEYYTTVVLRDQSNFEIAWLGSFGTFAVFFFAPFAGLSADKWGPTIPMVVGAVLQLVAIFMISLCEEYYQFFLAQGLLLGAGMSFIAIPASGMCPRYFKRNRGVALGISVSGSSIGGVLWPVACDQLLHEDGVSFAWTMRIIGFIMIPLLAVVLITVRPPLVAKAADGQEKPKPDRKELRKEIVKPPFLLLCAGLFLAYLGFFTPFFYVSVYATSHGMSQKLSFYLVSAINGASTLGRIIPGFLADKYGRFNMLFLSAFTGGIVAFCWTAATSEAGLIVWSLAYGFASGAILSLQAACGTTLVSEHAAGAAIGAAMGSVSLSGLFGPPISGELVKHGYIALAAWCGSSLMAGGVLIGCSRLWQDRRLTARI
ncbi:uncharacterized protein LTR77_002213 [Saxophila tyrrhenica]|uniref:Major facilitator superfamily (MFS) profile domain-containing protein n=1 Tax=Saxophila tyrrhenica TaxID=1690608 RepID=A0AAV9PKP3_9PEZI|nr:hypothetical protein LTR77_002213 [Saxophila tyrrhenica]